MSTRRPNLLVILTDEERYPPPYEREALAEFRREHLPARTELAARGVELHRHYAGSTACLPSRATLFTGQYPSLHGVRNTDGLAKQADDPEMGWLDPEGVPTMGDWFRAAGYQTHYRGKWHISHADLTDPTTGGGLATNTADGQLIPAAVHAYEVADPLEPFGFSGWVGPEPHGADPANMGIVRDPVVADQVIALLEHLAAGPDDGAPWLAVASFVNPHDIAFTGWAWQAFGLPEIPDWVPDIPEAPSQADSLDGRPACQAQFRATWPQMVYDQPADADYRRLYHFLLAEVDRHIGRVLDAAGRLGLLDDTVVVLSSDHGDLLGAHGGLQQKWHNAYEEAIHVPMVLAGPGVPDGGEGVAVPTSHVDVIPTLLGLVGADPEGLAAEVARSHHDTHPLPGRDLSAVVRGDAEAATVERPLYFMTEDEVSRGAHRESPITQTHYEPVDPPSSVESVIATVDGRLWKLNRYYDAAGGPGEAWELHDLTGDPEERVDRHADPDAPIARLRLLLEGERARVRRTPTEAAAGA